MVEKIKGYWNIFISHLSLSGNRKALGLITLVVIVAAIPLTVLVAQMQQETRQRAAGLETTPPYITLPYPPTATPTAILKPTSTPTPTLESSITILSPNGGEKWQIGNAYDVSWQYSGPSTCTVSVLLVDRRINRSYGGNPTPISALFNKYSFMVSKNILSGYNVFKIAVIGGKMCSSAYGESKNYFSILAPALTPTPTPKPTACTESDGGKDYYTYGIASGLNEYGITTADDYDVCNGNELAEKYCENNIVKNTYYDCPNGCKDGACLRSVGLNLELKLYGIGKNSGDNPNPKNKAKTVTVEFYDKRTLTMAPPKLIPRVLFIGLALVLYDSSTGTYKGNVPAYSLKAGEYAVKIIIGKYVKALAPNSISIQLQKANILPQLTLYAGDLNGDGGIYSDDLQIASQCMNKTTADCLNKADLNEDGKIDTADFNLFFISYNAYLKAQKPQ